MQVPVAAASGLGKLAFVTVAAVIPMAPGVHMFTTTELIGTALRSGLDATLIVVALAVGLAVPGLFVYRRRPEV